MTYRITQVGAVLFALLMVTSVFSGAVVATHDEPSVPDSSEEVTVESVSMNVTEVSGDAQPFTVNATYSNGTVVDVTDEAFVSSSDPSVVSVNGTELVPESTGTASITVKYKGFTDFESVSYGPFKGQTDGESQTLNFDKNQRNWTIDLIGNSTINQIVESYTKGPYQNGSGSLTLDNDTVNNNITIYGNNETVETGPYTYYDLENYTYNDNRLSDSNSARDIAWNGDGTRLVLLTAGGDVMHFNVSEAYNVSTATHDTTATGVDSNGNTIDEAEAIEFNDDGTTMFIGGANVWQYDLNTAYEYAGETASNFVERQPIGMAFNGDGTKLFAIDPGDSYNVYEYDLSTAYDLSSASSNAKHTHLMSNALDLSFNGDGTVLYMTDDSNDVNVYDLGTAYDLTTDSLRTTVTPQRDSSGTQTNGIRWNHDGSKFYTISGSDVGDGYIYQYDTQSGQTDTVPLQDPSVTLNGQTYSHSGNLSDGETATVSVSDLSADTYNWSTSQSSAVDWTWEMSGDETYEEEVKTQIGSVDIFTPQGHEYNPLSSTTTLEDGERLTLGPDDIGGSDYNYDMIVSGEHEIVINGSSDAQWDWEYSGYGEVVSNTTNMSSVSASVPTTEPTDTPTDDDGGFIGGSEDSWWDYVPDSVKEQITDRIAEHVTDPIKDRAQSVDQFVSGLIDGVADFVGGIADGIENAVDRVTGGLPIHVSTMGHRGVA